MTVAHSFPTEIGSKHVRHVFVTPDGKMRSRWQEAFPLAVASRIVPEHRGLDVLWILLPLEGSFTQLLSDCRAAAGELPLIVLSDTQSDEQGLEVLGAGFAGYCNGHAVPEVLRQVAATVTNGGVWIGQSLMQRLISGTAKLLANKPRSGVAADWASTLTEREIEVAHALAFGASNKEIARQLDISERTVKAHLGSVFEKLKVRDRLQLTLLINGVL